MEENYLIKKFFKKSFENLKSKKIFYKYFDKSYSYADLNEFYIKFKIIVTNRQPQYF